MTTCLLALAVITAYPQDNPAEIALKIDSVEKSLSYEHGTIQLKNGIGQIEVPKGFKYLNPSQAEHVLVDLWGNPKTSDMTLGMILPETQGVLSDSGYVFNIQYDEIGFVKDDDADEINYTSLLKDMQEETEEENKERATAGYEPITIVGWAASPFYDKEKKILHWAKEIKFGNQEENTLNYNIRILGRKGVLVLNAISTMPNLAQVKHDLPNVLDIVQFNTGFKYKDFDASADKIAGWTIGGLVAGKVLAKAGFFALLLKFWKIIAVAVVASFRLFWSKIRGKKNEKTEDDPLLPEQSA